MLLLYARDEPALADLEREQVGRARRRAAGAREARHLEPRRPRAVRLPRRHLAAVPRGSLEAGPARDDAALRRVRARLPERVRPVHGSGAPRRPPRPRTQRLLPRLPPAAPGRPRLLELRRPGRRGARTGAPTPSAGSGSPAKMVGRWPSGAPLALAPDERRPGTRRGERLRLLRSTTGTARAARLAHTSGAPIRETPSIRNRERQSRGRSTGATGSCAAAASTDRRSS